MYEQYVFIINRTIKSIPCPNISKFLTVIRHLTCDSEDCVGVCPEAGGDQHGVDGEREHDVSAGQGDDEHVRGHELPPPEHQHQDDQQVEDAAHQH